MTSAATSPNARLMERAREIKGRSLWQDARRRLFANKAAVASMFILGIIALMAIFADHLSPFGYADINYDMIACAPDWWPDKTVACFATPDHLFGTDSNGRDLFVRVLYGARVSLAVGVVATFVSLLIGVIYGATAGFLGGRVDNLMMRVVDVLYSLQIGRASCRERV